MGRTLYLECPTGISGDMAVAAMLDLGADVQVLRQVLKSLPLEGYEIKIGRVKKNTLDACDFDVILDQEHENHDHDMEYLYGHEHGTHQNHEEMHEHDLAGHAHVHRRLAEVQAIIRQGKMTESARDLALRIFDILADAEAKAHGVPKEQVHFHEVGSVDSIVDIVSFAVCFDNLDIDCVIVPRVCEGTGTVRCQHGILPVPVPAVENILQAYQIPLHIIHSEGEHVTPTGAAIAAAIRTKQELPKNFTIEKIGIGAGKRNYERPSFVRASFIQDADSSKEDRICKLETDIDDCSGAVLGYTMQLLFQAGARDVHYLPVYMKKDRPAYELCVICDPKDVSKIEQIIFSNTTSIGIRRVEMERSILEREEKTVQTPWGPARIKVCRQNGRKKYYPEYESVIELCEKAQKSYTELYGYLAGECEKNGL